MLASLMWVLKKRMVRAKFEHIGSCQVAAINLAPVGVQTTWAQVKLAVLSILAGNADGDSLPDRVYGGLVYLGKILGSPSP